MEIIFKCESIADLGRLQKFFAKIPTIKQAEDKDSPEEFIANMEIETILKSRLIENGISSIRQLLSMPKGKIMSLKGIGPQKYKEIEELCKKYRKTNIFVQGTEADQDRLTER